MAIIKLTDVEKRYRVQDVETLALEGINLEIEQGTFVSIMGPSGCGKSTLLNVAGLLDVPTGGTVEIMGTNMDNMSDNKLSAFRNANLGFIFQSFHLIPSLSVIDNVQLPLNYRSNVSASEAHKRAKAVLERIGMGHRMNHRPTELSGGQCQRVAIARALVGNPEIIFADEPTGNLDSHMGAEIMSILGELNKNDGKTVVMVTHNEDQARQTDRIIRLFDGHIVY